MVMWVRAVTGQEDDLNLNPQHTNKNPGVAACTCHPSTVEAENGSWTFRIMQTRGSSIYDDTGLGL